MQDWREIKGGWNNELDRLLFESHGFPCLARRNVHLGNWCGYVGVPKNHPAYGKSYSEIDVDVHGGLTYANRCDGDPVNGVCHKAKEGEPDDLYWLGFDCAHFGDITPVSLLFGIPSYDIHYWTLEEVKQECINLAEQLSKTIQ